MTIEQTVTIPADHRVFFEFLAPREIPAGKARVELKLTPVAEELAEREPAYLTSENPQSEDQKSATPATATSDFWSVETAAQKFDERIKGWAKWYPPETLEEFSRMPPILKALSGVIADAGDITYEQIRDERLAEKYGI